MLPPVRRLETLDTSQIRAVPSSAVVTTRVPSGLNSAHLTRIVWPPGPPSTAIGLSLIGSPAFRFWAFDMSHKAAVASSEPVTMRASFTIESRVVHCAYMALQDRQWVPRPAVPNTCSPISRSSDEKGTIIAKGGQVYQILMPLQPREQAAPSCPRVVRCCPQKP